MVHWDSEKADFPCFEALINQRVGLHHIEELVLESISLPEKKYDILCLGLRALWLCNPFYVLVESHWKRVTLRLTHAIIKLKHLHSLSTFRLVLNSILIESQLTMFYVLFRLQQNVEKLSLQTWWASKDKLGGNLGRENVWMFIAVWECVLCTGLSQRLLLRSTSR